MLKVGYIGLGLMGKSIARNILKAGFPLVVHNRSRAAVDELVAEGATAASSPREVAPWCGLLLVDRSQNGSRPAREAASRRLRVVEEAAGRGLVESRQNVALCNHRAESRTDGRYASWPQFPRRHASGYGDSHS